MRDIYDRYPIYIWDNGQVVETTWGNVFPTHLRNKYLLDTSDDSSELRYGMMETLPHKEGDYVGGWKSIPFEQFPSDFRMALLIMGIQ